MPEESWIPINQKLSGGLTISKLCCVGDDWQLFETTEDSRVLASKPKLADRWIEIGLLDETSLAEFSFGEHSLLLINSGMYLQLSSVTESNSPSSKSDAAAFAVSMKQTRRIIPDTPLHDAIYVERLSRLLPTWTVTEKISDERVLGSWLSGGVAVSTKSFRRITSLLGWMDKNDVRDVIELSGLDIPKNSGSVLAKSCNQDNKDNDIVDDAQQVATQEFEEPRMQLLSSKEFKLSGRPQLEEFFNEHVLDILSNEQRYKALGVEFPSSMVFYGPPGCGKTFAIEKLVDFLDWPTYHVDSSSVGSPFIHDTSRKISQVFEKAMENSPSVIVIDEMEAFLSDRQLNQSTGLHHVEEVAEFLRRMTEASANKVLVIGMTNRLEMIDQAILRRGRIDHIIEVEMPTAREVADLVTTLLDNMPTEDDLSVDKAKRLLNGLPISDVAFVVREAGRLAARAGNNKIDQVALDAAINQTLNSTKKKGEGGPGPVGY